jgi:hypothetical protein
VLLGLAVMSVGVFAGAMLTEGGVLVPYWQALPPDDFFRWYAANDARLLAFFGPLTTVAVVATMTAATVAFLTAATGRWWAVTAAGLMLIAAATFVVYFKAANASFAAAAISPEALETELSRWATWHWMRTAIAFAALTASALALYRPRL